MAEHEEPTQQDASSPLRVLFQALNRIADDLENKGFYQAAGRILTALAQYENASAVLASDMPSLIGSGARITPLGALVPFPEIQIRDANDVDGAIRRAFAELGDSITLDELGEQVEDDDS